MRIRLIGTAEELRREVQRLDACYGAVSVSRPYQCRGAMRGMVRIYIEIALNEPITVSATTDNKREGLPALPPGDLRHGELEHSS